MPVSYRRDGWQSEGSLESLGSSSGSSHSRQLSEETAASPEFIPTRTVIKPAATPVINPLQFVKVQSAPLYKKAEEQIKLTKEVKISKECMKEQEEEWQTNLDSWKTRRKKHTDVYTRKSKEIRQIELEEQLQKVNTRKIKTFSEIMEERSHKPKYNFSIPSGSTAMEPPSTRLTHPKNEDEDVSELESIKSDSISHECSQDEEDSGHLMLSSEKQPEWDKREVIRNVAQNQLPLFETKQEVFSADEGYGAEDIKDHSNFDEYENQTSSSGPSKTSSPKPSLEEQESLPKRENGEEMSFTLNLRPHDTKGFGFTIKGGIDKGQPAYVDSILPGTAADFSGVKVGDEVLSINGESSERRAYNAIVFALRQAAYTGTVNLILWRPFSIVSSEHFTKVEDTTYLDSPTKRPRSFAEKLALFHNIECSNNSNSNVIQTCSRSTASKTDSLVLKRRSAFESSLQDAEIEINKSNRWSVSESKPKISSESFWPKPIKKPPPVPAKPKFRSRPVSVCSDQDFNLDNSFHSNSDIGESNGNISLVLNNDEYYNEFNAVQVALPQTMNHLNSSDETYEKPQLETAISNDVPISIDNSSSIELEGIYDSNVQTFANTELITQENNEIEDEYAEQELQTESSNSSPEKVINDEESPNNSSNSIEGNIELENHTNSVIIEPELSKTNGYSEFQINQVELLSVEAPETFSELLDPHSNDYADDVAPEASVIEEENNNLLVYEDLSPSESSPDIDDCEIQENNNQEQFEAIVEPIEEVLPIEKISVKSEIFEMDEETLLKCSTEATLAYFDKIIAAEEDSNSEDSKETGSNSLEDASIEEEIVIKEDDELIEGEVLSPDSSSPDWEYIPEINSPETLSDSSGSPKKLNSPQKEDVERIEEVDENLEEPGSPEEEQVFSPDIVRTIEGFEPPVVPLQVDHDFEDPSIEASCTSVTTDCDEETVKEVMIQEIPTDSDPEDTSSDLPNDTHSNPLGVVEAVIDLEDGISDLDLSSFKEPPKEKPPPPPMEDDSSDLYELSSEFEEPPKDVKKKILKRKSDFFGFEFQEPNSDDYMPQPPPAIEDLLKAEREHSKPRTGGPPPSSNLPPIPRMSSLDEAPELEDEEAEIVSNPEETVQEEIFALLQAVENPDLSHDSSSEKTLTQSSGEMPLIESETPLEITEEPIRTMPRSVTLPTFSSTKSGRTEIFNSSRHLGVSSTNSAPSSHPSTPDEGPSKSQEGYFVLTRPDLFSLAAAPKAKLIDNNQWITEKQTATLSRKAKLQEHPLTFNRNYWVQQENQYAVPPLPQHRETRPPSPPTRTTSTLPSPTCTASAITIPLPKEGTAVRWTYIVEIQPPSNRPCKKCAEAIGRGPAVSAVQTYFHPQCFCCGICQVVFVDSATSSSVKIHNSTFFCQTCFTALLET